MNWTVGAVAFAREIVVLEGVFGPQETPMWEILLQIGL